MKNGITVASVTVMVVIIMILLGTVTVASYNSIQNANKLTFAIEIAEIQEEVTRYYKNSMDHTYPITEEVYTITLSQLTTDVATQFAAETKDENDTILVYAIDLETINITDTKYGNKKSEKDVYVVSTVTGKVYYLDGVKANRKTYYTLTQDLIDINERNTKTDESITYAEPPSIITDGIIARTLSSGEKEIYISNIQISGDNIKIKKYELGIISEDIANTYFQSNGSTIIKDRIKLKQETDVTLYVENSEGEYIVEYLYKSE